MLATTTGIAEGRAPREFVLRDRFDQVVRQKAALKKYLKQLDTFLEALLLLVHLTAGQPTRGMEIIGVLYTNTIFHWNIFAEDGLVLLVTSYHKGCTCTGATKIMHLSAAHPMALAAA